MKAILHDRYGTSDVLQLRDLDIPPVGDDEVLVRIRAAAVNRGDALAVEGIPYAARLSYGISVPKQRVPGTDMAGTVEAVGSNVTAVEPGDDVFGWTKGAFAQVTSTRGDLVVPKPEQLTFEQAAAAPTAGVTALQALRDVGRLERGHRVLVVGASGGVGTFAIQMAKAFGAEVTGVCSTRNVDLVRSTGADHVIDYTREDFTSQPARYDLVLDLVGREPLSVSRQPVSTGGTYVAVAGGNPRSLTGMSRFASTFLLTPFVRQRLRPLFAQNNPEDLASVSDLLETGSVLPVIDSVYDLRDTPEAIASVQSGHSRGKVVITI